MDDDQQEIVPLNGDAAKDLIVLAVHRYYPTEDEEPEEVDKTAPQLSAQLTLEKGKRYKVLGPVQWWLYVKSMDTEECGYVPSTHVVPLKKDLSIQEQKDIDNGAELSPSMVQRKDIEMTFFPASPVERDMLNRKLCPEESANILSKITFWWLTKLIYTGFKRPLEDKDLWALAERNRSSNIVPKLSAKWEHLQEKYKKEHPQKSTSEIDNNEEPNQTQKEIQANGDEDKDQETVKFVPKNEDKKKTKYKGPSLAKALFLMFWRKFLLAVLFKLIHDIAIFVQPQLLRLLIMYIEEKSSNWVGYVYCVGMFVVSVIQSFALHQYFHIMISLGMNIRTSIIGMVYPKALVLSNESRKTSTAGEMVNLMTTDAQRLMELMNYLNTLWSGPFQISVALYFLYNTMGVSILAGVGVMLLLIPMNFLASRIVKKLQVKTMASKDKRLKMINEILNGIKVLKLYAWEASYLQKVLEVRKDELKHQKNSMYVHAGFSFTYTCAPFLVSLATFSIYVLTGNILTAEKAFVAIALFNILRFPLVMFPNIIINYIQSRVSIQRLQDFLNLEELDPNNVTKIMPEHLSNQAIHVENCSVKWDKKDAPILKDVNLNITTGSLVAVVGQVGSGKSTLLSALLGETEKVNGQVYLQGSVAYVPQQAWIQNATLRDNVLFGRTFDRERYRSTIKACALQTDLDLLPSGDMTEIGEKGINLSGGQKQRVNLARAVYFNADVYLLDDPLSAVDSHVGKHLFDKVIGPRGKLRKKTRVLVTHAVHFLPQVDQIIVLQDGRISEVGTYDELQANQGAFAEFLKTYANEKQDDPQEDIHRRDRSHTHHSDIHEYEEANLTVSDMDHIMGSTSELDVIVKSASRLTLTETDSIHADGRTLVSEDKTVQKVIEEETSEVGRVRFSVFYKYAKAAGLIVCFLFFFFLLASEGSIVSSQIWLARWSSDNVTTATQRDTYLFVYGALGISQAFFMLFSSLALAYGANVASNALHDHLLVNIMHSPMSFFESTPMGRIVNRFSKDMYVIDETVPTSLMSFWRCFFAVLSTFFAISYATPIFLSVVFPLMVVYGFIQRLYVSSSRQLRRIESMSRSPIYNNFLETINGTSTIRAYSQQQHFIQENYYRVDENQVAYYPWISSNRWLAIRLELIGSFVIFFASLFIVVYKDSVESGLAGLSLTHALRITQTLNWMVRMSGELETNIVAVERVKEYSETPREAAWIIEDNRPPEDWPGSGHIAIETFDLRYRENLPLVLKNINCDIAPGEKIGLVGRTGAGKSSLSLALFRILESSGGRIVIDDIDISRMGLQDLRSRLTIIPQDPVLFSGTLRFNLDPFDKHSDEELWKVLEVSHLKQFVSGLAEGLQHAVSEGGENLSVGQRQLVCLARALLKKSKVLVLDEATAAVDLETDELIQKTIRTEFADRTVLTIAHRLNTIMDYSRILVLDKGFMAEFDSPSNLLYKKGMFYEMAKDANLA